MFGMRWRLFRLLGIPVSVDLSWLLILALLTLSFAEGFPRPATRVLSRRRQPFDVGRFLDHGPHHGAGILRLHRAS